MQSFRRRASRFGTGVRISRFDPEDQTTPARIQGHLSDRNARVFVSLKEPGILASDKCENALSIWSTQPTDAAGVTGQLDNEWHAVILKAEKGAAPSDESGPRLGYAPDRGSERPLEQTEAIAPSRRAKLGFALHFGLAQSHLMQ
jgi:hypothetical protein